MLKNSFNLGLGISYIVGLVILSLLLGSFVEGFISSLIIFVPLFVLMWLSEGDDYVRESSYDEFGYLTNSKVVYKEYLNSYYLYQKRHY